MASIREILELVTLYFDGLHYADTKKLRAIFHPDTILKAPPHINIRITDDNVTHEQKLAIVQACTQLMVDILNKDPQKTFVVIDEVPKENWGIGYQLLQ